MERSLYKMLVFFQDAALNRREMFIDVREIAYMNKWDDRCDKRGYCQVYFKSGNSIDVLLDSYHELLGKWLSV